MEKRRRGISEQNCMSSQQKKNGNFSRIKYDIRYKELGRLELQNDVRISGCCIKSRHEYDESDKRV